MRFLQDWIKRALICLSLPDAGDFPFVQVRYFNKTKKAHVLLPSGLSHTPREGTQTVLFSILGDEGNCVAIPYETVRRLKGLQPGETAIYNSKTGDFVVFKNDGSVTLQGKDVTVRADSVHITGTLSVDKQISCKAGIEAEGVIVSAQDCVSGGISGNAHVHAGVQSGPETTGGPQ